MIFQTHRIVSLYILSIPGDKKIYNIRLYETESLVYKYNRVICNI